MVQTLDGPLPASFPTAPDTGPAAVDLSPSFVSAAEVND